MTDISDMIEAYELRLMESWMQRDASAIRKLAARDCMMIFGSNPPELLDRPSFVAAVEKDFRCIAFRMGHSMVRQHKRSAWYTASADLELKLGARDWKGQFLITGLWRKHRFGGWKLAERSLSFLDREDWASDRIRRMQMWR